MRPQSHGPRFSWHNLRAYNEKFCKDHRKASSLKFKYFCSNKHIPPTGQSSSSSSSKIPSQDPIPDQLPHCFTINNSPANRTDRYRPFISFNIRRPRGKVDMNDVDTEPLRSSKVLDYTDGAKSHQRRRCRKAWNPVVSARTYSVFQPRFRARRRRDLSCHPAQLHPPPISRVLCFFET
jgi:hypothetical protein